MGKRKAGDTYADFLLDTLGTGEGSSAATADARDEFDLLLQVMGNNSDIVPPETHRNLSILSILVDGSSALKSQDADAMGRMSLITSQMQDVLNSLSELTENTPLEDVQRQLQSAEAKASDARSIASGIRRSHAVQRITELLTLVAAIEEKCRTWRERFPDDTPININNRWLYRPQVPTATLAAYCLVLANRVFDGASRRAANLTLRMMRLFGQLLMSLGPHESPPEQHDAINAIPTDIRTVETHFNLGIETVVLAVCPKCSFTHPPSIANVYPDTCLYWLNDHFLPCNTALLEDGKPIKKFEYYPFLQWFARFRALPGVREHADRFCDEVASCILNEPDVRTKASDGCFFRELLGNNGKNFVSERGAEGRWFFTLYADFFNVEGNRADGKPSKAGVMALTCLNLPVDIRNDPAYVYIRGIIPGPGEPEGKQSHHRHYLKPLINDLYDGYARGVRVDCNEQTPPRIERIALAAAVMDLKAARPFAGHVEVTSHVFCHVCKVWHMENVLCTDYENWEPSDDARFREGSQKWLNADSRSAQKRIEKLFGARLSAFHQLPYWRISVQCVVDPMHTVYLRAEKMFWKALGLANPGDGDDDDDDDSNDSDDDDDRKQKDQGEVCFYHSFTPSPPLSSVKESKDILPHDVLVALAWDHLPDETRQWWERKRDELEREILANNLLKELRSIEDCLSLRKPTTGEEKDTMAEDLKKNRSVTLLYVCCGVLALSREDAQKSLSKLELSRLLVKWRVEEVQQEVFVWPNFTTHSDNLPRSLQQGPLDQNARSVAMEIIKQRMTYSTAVGIGFIHRLLRQPIKWSERTKLDSRLQREAPTEALRFVCLDVDCLQPAQPAEKEALVRRLIHWRLAMPTEAIPRITVPSADFLARVHTAIQKTLVPSEITKPPPNIGLPAAGSVKAENWRVLFEIHLPLALLSCSEGSPIALSNAGQMAGAVETSMWLTCASLNMAKRSLTLDDRLRFRHCWQRHIEGIKAYFPGFRLPVHHVGSHIFDFMDWFGPVHNFWCFAGERLIRKLQGVPINHKPGEYESTLLHAYSKSASFRQWLLTCRVPGLFQKCIEVLEDLYGSTFCFGERDVTVEAENIDLPVGKGEIPLDKLPVSVARLLPVGPSESFHQIHHALGRFTTAVTHVANCYICFYPDGRRDQTWIAARIEHIVRVQGKIQLVIRRSQDTSRTTPDPFSTFWSDGFEAKLVSSSWQAQPELIDWAQVAGHTARWQLSDDEIVVLKLG